MKRFVLCGVVLLAFVSLACDDPSPDEIEKAKNIELQRITGVVTEKSVGYYSLGEMKNRPYYCITIQTTNRNSSMSSAAVTSNQCFRGVPIEIFDSLEVGDVLPLTSIASVNQLLTINGVVVDRQADLPNNRWFVVIRGLDGINVYRVEKNIYYTYLDVGARLPMTREELGLSE